MMMKRPLTKRPLDTIKRDTLPCHFRLEGDARRLLEAWCTGNSYGAMISRLIYAEAMRREERARRGPEPEDAAGRG